MGNTDASARVDSANRVIQAQPRVLYRAFADGDTLMQWLPPGDMQGRALAYDFRDETVRIYAGVNNLTNQKPDLDTIYPVSPAGRYIYVGAKARIGGAK